MVLEDKTLNNIVNFTSSYLLNSVLKTEELLNDFSLYCFNKDRKTIMMCVGMTMVAGKNDPISYEINATREFLASKLFDFLKDKNIEHDISTELSILLDNEVETITQIIQKYTISRKRASKIFELYKSLL
jgi:hypothetical protein